MACPMSRSKPVPASGSHSGHHFPETLCLDGHQEKKRRHLCDAWPEGNRIRPLWHPR